MPTDKNLIFNCKICKKEASAPFIRLSNLNQHLKLSHGDILSDWLERYRKYSNADSTNILDEKVLQLVKWFIVSNGSFTHLKIPYLRNILHPSLEIPSYYHFRLNILPNVMQKLYLAIENKLKDAITICLVIDIWTNNSNIDFLGCAAITTNKLMDRETYVIGLTPMSGAHNAENIRTALINLLNRYKFNKLKIHGVVCDEGKNLVRLFDQIDFNIEEYRLDGPETNEESKLLKKKSE